MDVSVGELVQLIGEQQVEIRALRRALAALEAHPTDGEGAAALAGYPWGSPGDASPGVPPWRDDAEYLALRAVPRGADGGAPVGSADPNGELHGGVDGEQAER